MSSRSYSPDNALPALKLNGIPNRHSRWTLIIYIYVQSFDGSPSLYQETESSQTASHPPQVDRQRSNANTAFSSLTMQRVVGSIETQSPVGNTHQSELPKRFSLDRAAKFFSLRGEKNSPYSGHLSCASRCRRTTRSTFAVDAARGTGLPAARRHSSRSQSCRLGGVFFL